MGSLLRPAARPPHGEGARKDIRLKKKNRRRATLVLTPHNEDCRCSFRHCPDGGGLLGCTDTATRHAKAKISTLVDFLNKKILGKERASFADPAVKAAGESLEAALEVAEDAKAAGKRMKTAEAVEAALRAERAAEAAVEAARAADRAAEVKAEEADVAFEAAEAAALYAKLAAEAAAEARAAAIKSDWSRAFA